MKIVLPRLVLRCVVVDSVVVVRAHLRLRRRIRTLLDREREFSLHRTGKVRLGPDKFLAGGKAQPVVNSPMFRPFPHLGFEGGW